MKHFNSNAIRAIVCSTLFATSIIVMNVYWDDHNTKLLACCAILALISLLGLWHALLVKMDDDDDNFWRNHYHNDFA